MIKKYSYYDLQWAIIDFLDSTRTKYYNKDGITKSSLLETPEVEAMFAAQHPTKTFSKKEILDNFTWWVAKVLHIVDAFRILREYPLPLDFQTAESLYNKGKTIKRIKSDKCFNNTDLAHNTFSTEDIEVNDWEIVED